MLGNHVLLTINYTAAALAANQTYRFSLPFGFTLVGVNAASADTTSFILDIGTAADDDAYLDGKTVTGAASTTTDFGQADFVGAQYPHVAPDTEMHVSIDYDGGAGGDAAGVCITLILAEG